MVHTPKHWIAQNYGGKGWFIVTEDDLILAMTVKGDDSDEADARLVAAAPDLLDALHDLTALYASLPGHNPHFVEKGLAAIAKATGPQAPRKEPGKEGEDPMDRCKIHGKRLIGTAAEHGHCPVCCIEANPEWRTKGFINCPTSQPAGPVGPG